MVTIIAPNNPEILILGAGWTSTFLIPLLTQESITHAATTTTGHDKTLKFAFDFDEATNTITEPSKSQLAALPTAKTVLITFPLRGPGRSKALIEAYNATHASSTSTSSSTSKRETQFIQLGSSGIFEPGGQTLRTTHWITRHSPYDEANPRAVAEDELLKLGGCVLNLSGLWGGQRQPKTWIDRVAATKVQLAGKKSLHMIHGRDVARGILGVHRKFEEGKGERFILTDLLVYDWWALILGFAGDIDEENGNEDRAGRQIKWVGELMEEHQIRSLPRSNEQLGRCYDATEFWRTFGIMPTRARI